ncbi:hypothetical protein EXIGLDRAFT_375985 [Exidia glandulosa HHB12029]|uniref:Zn(2)-C6 fungal-type domain-containing protein n=1 Tax=Exidia glandulosa HHB12029 TaxID=1314781 RepID=A0A165Q001_EXIGL|nr:hypothetical protein EXIGLDRAFT_375985 [Exidia glandulosa HHB12029]
MSQQMLPPLPSPPGSSDYNHRRATAEPGKGKASTRAKSGCWTCRIRRKKCDEIKTPEGHCQTCVRLRLECLGWGSRRPDWMREKNNVLERREKIKEFLATNGMIKGHAGAISRTPAETAPEVLTLRFNGINAPNRERSDSGDNMLPPMGMSDHDTRRRNDNALLNFAYVASDAQLLGHSGGMPSGMGGMARGPLDMHGGPMLPPLNMTLGNPNLSQMGRDITLSDAMGGPSPLDPAMGSYGLPEFSTPTDSDMTVSSSSTAATIDGAGSGGRSIVSLQNSTWLNPFTPSDSSFGRLYNHLPDEYEELDSPENAAPSGDLVLAGGAAGASSNVYVDPATGMTMPGFTTLPFRWLGEMPNSQFVFHYLKEVLPIQYLLADQTTIRQWTYNLAQTSESTRSALCLLAALHQHCMAQMSITGPVGSTTELDVFYSNTRNALRSAKTITEGDAMASLHVISSFLFAGGRGPWHEYLDIASRWVESVLQDPRFPTPRDALRHASESVRFIIRATFWFDCLAAVSQLRSPQFLHIYRQLFGMPIATIDSDDPDVSMMDVMGCSATGFLSLAEIAALAHWKEEQRKLGKLSYPRLVERGHEIENRYLSSHIYEPGDVSYVGGANTGLLLTPDGVEFRRRLVSNVFRASAKVYLHSVISGGFPETPEIASGVQETINCLKAVPGYSDASRVVVRSVVFSICIAGCMTDDATQQEFFLEQLQALGKEAEVLGNCSQARKLMQQVWQKRKQSGSGEVLWREAMFEAGPGILLLA